MVMKTRRWLKITALVAASGLLAWLALGLHRRLLSAGLFLRMEGAKAGWLAQYGARQLDERSFSLPSGTRARLYWPRGAPRAGLVLAHGIHEEGIDEKRLVGFARALASSGQAVLTPELSDLAHYRVTHAGAETIAEAARALAHELGREQVGVFGISFGGGLAIRAACEPGLRGAISHVIGLGAHNDVKHVARFFLDAAVGLPVVGPDGEQVSIDPHPYGAKVLFQALFGVSHKGKLTMEEHDRLLGALRSKDAEMAAASPRGCREPPRVPLYLVHGLGDRIVPYTETLWNEAQFAGTTRVEVLVSQAIVHAEYAPPTFWQRLQLVNFMANATR